MKTIPLDPRTLVEHINDMYQSLNSDETLPEVSIQVNDGTPVIVIEEDEMDAILAELL
jgi:hypothetical protein